ncbi:hypothetical protein, partial [Escherichia coli]|uniref:hypothetical protein n=1 Tax=Escherichia coli TaxID=562 RepID=UPI003BA0B8A3
MAEEFPARVFSGEDQQPWRLSRHALREQPARGSGDRFLEIDTALPEFGELLVGPAKALLEVVEGEREAELSP